GEGAPGEGGISRQGGGRTLPPMTLAFLSLAAALSIAAWTTRSWLLGIAGLAQAGVAGFPPRAARRANTSAGGHLHSVVFAAKQEIRVFREIRGMIVSAASASPRPPPEIVSAAAVPPNVCQS